MCISNFAYRAQEDMPSLITMFWRIFISKFHCMRFKRLYQPHQIMLQNSPILYQNLYIQHIIHNISIFFLYYQDSSVSRSKASELRTNQHHLKNVQEIGNFIKHPTKNILTADNYANLILLMPTRSCPGSAALMAWSVTENTSTAGSGRAECTGITRRTAASAVLRSRYVCTVVPLY